MQVLWTTAAWFLAALAIHLLVWRVRIPKFQTRALLGIFALVPAGEFLLGWGPRLGTFEVAHICLFYVALSFSYIITYSALEGDSPTLSLIRHLDRSRGQGIASKDVESFLQDRPFIKARLEALIRDGLVREEQGRYFVEGHGSLFFRLILGFRRLYGPIQTGG